MIVLIIWTIFLFICIVTSIVFYILDSLNIINWNFIFYSLPMIIGVVSMIIPIVCGIIDSAKDERNVK